MIRFRFGLLLFALALVGCDHSKSTGNNSAAVPQGDSALTGEKTALAADGHPPYPRAQLVALPPSAPAQPPASVAGTNAAPESPAVAATTPAETAPSDSAPSVATSIPAAVPDSSAPANATPDSPSNVIPPLPALPSATTDTSTDATASAPTPAQMPPAASSSAPLDELDASRQVVVINTSLGRIVIQLDDVAAPRTCGNFRKLVTDGFYNHTAFHRVIPHFIIQGGDPNSKSDDRSTYGQGDPGYTLPEEIDRKAGVRAVAIARLPDSVNPKRDSNGSQFFICVAPCPSLDGQYTVFAHVIKGIDVAEKIAEQPRDQRDDPVTRVEMAINLEPKFQALQENSAEK